MFSEFIRYYMNIAWVPPFFFFWHKHAIKFYLQPGGRFATWRPASRLFYMSLWTFDPSVKGHVPEPSSGWWHCYSDNYIAWLKVVWEWSDKGLLSSFLNISFLEDLLGRHPEQTGLFLPFWCSHLQFDADKFDCNNTLAFCSRCGSTVCPTICRFPEVGEFQRTTSCETLWFKQV